MNTLRLLLKFFGTVMLLLCIFSEIVMGMPVTWWIYLMLALGFSIALMPRKDPGQHLRSIAALGGILTLIALLFLVAWSSRKPFLRDLYRIREGMTVTEVSQIMGKYMEGTGKSDSASAVPGGEMQLNDSLVFRHSNDGDFDADFGIVTFSGGRVTKINFRPD